MASSGEVTEDGGKKKGRLRSIFGGKSEKKGAGALNDPPTPQDGLGGDVRPRKDSKKKKKSSASSRGSHTSIGSPPPEVARRSPILETTPGSQLSGRHDAAILSATSSVGGRAESHPSLSDLGESVFAEPSLPETGTERELFHDDPRRVVKPKPPCPTTSADEAKPKSSDEEDPRISQLKLVEQELQEKERLLSLHPNSSSIPKRLISLFSAYEDQQNKSMEEQKLCSRSHEKARKKMEEEHRQELEAAETRRVEEVTSIRSEREGIENKWKEEKERLLQQHTHEIERLSMELERVRETEKLEREKREKNSYDHERELAQLKEEMEQLRKHVNDEEEKLRRVTEERDRLLTQCQQLERDLKEVEELQKEENDAEKDNQRVENEVAELKHKCDEQQTKITELENEISVSESKRHGQEKLAKSYEEKLKKLEQRLEEETKVRIAIEEQLQASGEQERAKFHDLQTELREKESELAELAKLLRTVQEQLCEQETKREESQRKLELLQKTTALQTSKSQEDLDKYCDSVTKLCEELTDLKKKSEDQQKEIEKLRETLKRAEQIEVEYTEATKKLSEVEAKLKAVESQARLVPPTAGGAEQISDTAGTTAAANAELQAKTATVEKLEKEVDELRAELKARDQEVCELKGKEREISPHTSKEVKKLKREVDELREKLRSRDEELSDLKKGNTPFVDASLSPTDSMTADSSEVVELKLKMRERETELENLQRQVQSMEQALLELNRLRKVSESLKMENEKLLHRSKSVSDHSKRQSEQIMALRKQLETRALPVVQAPVQSSENEEWKTKAEMANEKIKNLQAKLKELTRELAESRKDCSRKVVAIDVANEQAQLYQQKLEKEVKAWKEKAEKMKSTFSLIIEENKTLKQAVKEKDCTVAAAKEASAIAAVKFKESLERLKEESHQKDLILQQSGGEFKELKSKLTAAEAKCQELQELNEDLIQHSQRAAEERGREEEIEKLREEVKVKSAQVSQYKKQLQEKAVPKPNEELERLQIELATSRSNQEETEKQFKQISLKHNEMQKQYDKKLQEMEQLVQQLKTQNCLLEGLMRESEAKQKLMEKKKALELSQSQQQQAEIMSELSRMQKDRKREDEFSKAFREEFEAHKTMKGKCAALQNQLDSYLDTLDGMRQMQEVLMHTLQEHGIEPPFVEPQQMPEVQVKSETHQEEWAGHHPQVAISQKPIASPGVFNQHIDQAGYMPPHSNAESQYLEQQAERMASSWQQQRMYNQQPGRDQAHGGAAAQRARGDMATHQVGSYESEAVVGLSASTVGVPIAHRDHQTTPLTPQWLLQSRHSDSEIQNVQAVPRHSSVDYPVSPYRVGHRHQPAPNVHPTVGQLQPAIQLHPAQAAFAGHRPDQHHLAMVGQQRAATLPPSGKPPQHNFQCGQYSPYHHQQRQQVPLEPLAPSQQPTAPPSSRDFALPSAPTEQEFHGTLPPPHAEFVKPVPETGSVVPPEPFSGVSRSPNPPTPAPDVGSSSTTPASRKESAGEEQGLMKNLSGAIKETFEKVNDDEDDRTESMDSGLQSIPPDPNLRCVVCGRVFKIGQIQNFKRHSETCTGYSSS